MMIVYIKCLGEKYIFNQCYDFIIESNRYVDVYYWSFDRLKKTSYSDLDVYLTPLEKQRGESYLDNRERLKFFYCRAIIKQTLFRILEMDIATTALIDLHLLYQWINFSVSHTDKGIILAVAKKGYRVGVDIESTLFAERFVTIGKRLFVLHGHEGGRNSLPKVFRHEWMVRECLIKMLNINFGECLKITLINKSLPHDNSNQKPSGATESFTVGLVKFLLSTNELVYLLIDNGRKYYGE